MPKVLPNMSAEMDRRFMYCLLLINGRIDMNTKRKLRYFYHDLANHLQVASRMNTEDGKAYLSKMLQSSNLRPEKLKKVGTTEQELQRLINQLEKSQKENSDQEELEKCKKAVFYLLDSKKQICVNENIEVEFLVQLPIVTSILCNEWVSLFGNLLDNAIEACRHVDTEKRIRLTTEDRGGIWLLTMENTVGHHDRKKGSGIRIIRKLVKKGKGHFKMENVGTMMISKIWFPVIRR